jgi:hypothetical protein
MRTLMALTALIALSLAACGDEYSDSFEGDELSQTEQELSERAERSSQDGRIDSTDINRPGGSDESIEYLSCRAPAPVRQAFCHDGFWTTGIRCSNQRSCDEGTICLAPRNPYCVFLAPEPEPIECPRGTVGPEVQILCAPGFELTQVTRGGCVTCIEVEAECDVVENCRESDLSFEECVVRIVGSRARAAAVLAHAALVDLSAEAVLEVLACGDAGPK